MAKTRRNYTGNAVTSTTSASIAASGTTSFTIADSTGWPYGAAPFYIVVEPGSSSEEKMLVTRAGSTDSTLSVYSTPSVGANRGLDGTVAVSHSSGSVVYPVFTAMDADEANEMASTLTTKGDLLTHGTASFARLGVGSNNTVLMADSTATNGIKWAQVGTSAIATDAVTADKIAAGAVASSELASAAVTTEKIAAGAVTTTEIGAAAVVAAKIATSAVETAKIADLAVETAKLADGGVTEAKLANTAVTTAKLANTAVTTAKIADAAVTTVKLADGSVTADKLASGAVPSSVPTGSVTPFAGATSPSGWVLCDGSAYSRTNATYSALFAVIGTTFGVGDGSTTFNVPDLRNRFVAGLGTTTWSNTRGKTGGTKDAVVVSHTHTVSDHQHDIAHTHTNEIRGTVGTFTNGATGLYHQGGTGISSTFGNSRSSGDPSNSTSGAAGSQTTSGASSAVSGTDQNLPPYLTLNHIIKL